MANDDSAPGPGAGWDPQALARDWVTVWQSELAAAAVDREGQETWQTMLAVWAGAAAAMAHAWPAPGGERGRSGTAAASRPASVGVAPDARDVEIERLGRRVAELERRLDAGA